MRVMLSLSPNDMETLSSIKSDVLNSHRNVIKNFELRHVPYYDANVNQNKMDGFQQNQQWKPFTID